MFDPLLDSLLPFALACLLIELTPGPNMAFLAIISVTEGKRSGVATVFGITLGLTIIGLLAALGVATLITNSPALYQVLRVGGIGYLLWLAWQGWQDAGENSASQVKAKQPLSTFFKHGLFVNLLNPKAATFYIAILPTFMPPQQASTSQAIFLTLVSVCIATCIYFAIVMFSAAFRPFLIEPKRNRIFRRTLSILLALVAIWFGWSTHKSL